MASFTQAWTTQSSPEGSATRSSPLSSEAIVRSTASAWSPFASREGSPNAACTIELSSCIVTIALYHLMAPGGSHVCTRAPSPNALTPQHLLLSHHERREAGA